MCFRGSSSTGTDIPTARLFPSRGVARKHVEHRKHICFSMFCAFGSHKTQKTHLFSNEFSPRELKINRKSFVFQCCSASRLVIPYIYKVWEDLEAFQPRPWLSKAFYSSPQLSIALCSSLQLSIPLYSFL